MHQDFGHAWNNNGEEKGLQETEDLHVEAAVQDARSGIVKHPYTIEGSNAIGREIVKIKPLPQKGQDDAL